MSSRVKLERFNWTRLGISPLVAMVRDRLDMGE